MGQLFFDPQQQSKLLHDDISICIEAILAKLEFSLLAADKDPKYAVKLEKAMCIMPRVWINPRYLLSKQQEIDYYYINHKMNIHVIPQGTVNFSKQIGGGFLPRRVVVMMIKECAYNGSYQHSPFNYDHFNINFAQLQLGANCKFPMEPMRPNFEENELKPI